MVVDQQNMITDLHELVDLVRATLHPDAPMALEL